MLPAGATQVTAYQYQSDGLIPSNDLLTAVVYPDNGRPHAETYTYDAVGEVTGMTDRNGTTHAYRYDVLGRPVSGTELSARALGEAW